MPKTYVIQTVTGREEKAKLLIEAAVQDKIIIPYKIISKKYEGAWHEIKSILFPGYLFVETDDIFAFIDSLPIRFFNTYMKGIGKDKDKDGVRFLSVKEEELELIKKLCLGDVFEVAMSRGIKVDGKVKFTEGPLVGMEGYVRKIDRHKRSVTLEMEMFGRVQRLTVGAEIINGATVVE